jgi:hypothetical protein
LISTIWSNLFANNSTERGCHDKDLHSGEVFWKVLQTKGSVDESGGHKKVEHKQQRVEVHHHSFCDVGKLVGVVEDVEQHLRDKKRKMRKEKKYRKIRRRQMEKKKQRSKKSNRRGLNTYYTSKSRDTSTLYESVATNVEPA